MNQAQKDYQKLHEISKQTTILKGIKDLLDWDQETYMPPGASNARADQLKTLAGIMHREHTGRKFANALGKLINIKTGKSISKALTQEQQAAVKEWWRDYHHNTALPAKFVEEFAKLQSQSITAWRSAKAENAFQQFAPFLDRIISMNRKKADLLGYKEHPYDALLDEYEPDLTTREVSQMFDKLQTFISPFLKKLTKTEIDNSFLYGNWDHSKQMTFSYKILDAMGYDMHHGRVDLSAHPFSSSMHPTDSRITTRIHPNSLVSNILTILHEGGHALYEMGLPQDQYGTPLGESRSLGVHESQSRWWETRIGLSKPFWHHFYPILQETFHKQLDQISLDKFYRAINKVKPSLIRVEADEVTYPLHIILRFELEKGLIEGNLKVRDIPDIWNAKMKEYLGIEPRRNTEGCLQDIHWSMGAFGYFPTYVMGTLYTSHLFEAFAKAHPDWEKQVKKGHLSFVRDWLSTQIYRHGRRYPTHELLKQAAGRTFSEEPFLKYLREKYAKLA